MDHSPSNDFETARNPWKKKAGLAGQSKVAQGSPEIARQPGKTRRSTNSGGILMDFVCLFMSFNDKSI